MPFPDISTIIGAIVVALGGGATGAAAARRKATPGTLDDHDERIEDAERAITALAEWRAGMEARYMSLNADLARAIDNLAESNERIWKALESAAGKIEKMHERVIKLDVETAVERELRRQREGTKP